MPGIVLVVDDEPAIVESLTKIFRREGLNVLAATDGNAGLDLLRKHRVGVLLTDLMMPRTTGMDLLRAAKTIAPETEVVLMTAYGTVETAVDAMKEGAYDFVTKPLKRAHVVRIVRNALEKQSLLVENRSLKAQLAEKRRRAIIGTSLAWRRTMDIVMQAAPSEATVLLLGESGTGKELLARALHDNTRARARARSSRSTAPRSPRRSSRPSCSATRRARSPARRRRAMAASRPRTAARCSSTRSARSRRHVQVKLLRVLQEGEIERLGGGGKPRRIDVRLVAATNVDLAEEVKAGRFREDLFYRLNVIPVTVPPLRDRRDDIPLLAQHFVQVYAEKNGKAISGCSPTALERLTEYGWPGNVRELENAIERAVVLTRAGHTVIDEDALPREIRDATPGTAVGHLADVPARHAARRDRDARDPRDAAPHARRQAPDREAARHRDPHDLPPARGARIPTSADADDVTTRRRQGLTHDAGPDQALLLGPRRARRARVRGVRRQGDEPRHRGEVPRRLAEDAARSRRSAPSTDAPAKPARSKDGAPLATRNMFCSECTPAGRRRSNTDPSSDPDRRRCRSCCSRPTSAPTRRRTPTRRSSTPRTRSRARTRSAIRFRARPARSRRSTSSTSTSRTTAASSGSCSPARPPPVAAPVAVAEPAPTDESKDDLQASIDNGIKKIDDTNYEIDKSLVDKVLANPMAVAKGARVVPAVKNGKPDGFKLYAIRPSSVYSKLGLTNGDTLQSINGFELTTADKALEVYTKLREATSLEVEVTRRGKPITLKYSIR